MTMMKQFAVLMLSCFSIATLGQEAAAKSCRGDAVFGDAKVTVGNCWTKNDDAQKLIANACGQGDSCEVHGDVTRGREIKRVDWATGPKGMSFKMKPCAH